MCSCSSRYDADVTVDAEGAVAEMGASVASGVMEASFIKVTGNHRTLPLNYHPFYFRPVRMQWQNCFKMR